MWANKKSQRLPKKYDFKESKKELQIWAKRNRQVNDYYNKATKILTDYCVKNDIGKIVVGYNKTIYRKNKKDNFRDLPTWQFRLKLKQKCKLYNIEFITQEESYTSKSDFLGNDILPIINVENIKEYKFKGKRISRGQYRSSTGEILNADVNAALNILKKSNIVDIDNLMKQKIQQPTRIKVS